MSQPIQEFIGIKRIAAWPQEKDGKPGYAVRYPDGYVSWSPKDEFEKFYMPLTFEPEIGAASSRGEIVNYPTKDSYEKFARAVSAGDDGTCHNLLDFLVHWASIGAPKIDAPEYVYTKPPRGALRIQELLPDNYSESKDWRDGDPAERIEWLKSMLTAMREREAEAWKQGELSPRLTAGQVEILREAEQEIAICARRDFGRESKTAPKMRAAFPEVFEGEVGRG